MPYTAEINRAQPTCFLFLLDQSASMGSPSPGSRRSKAEGVADAVNRLLQNIIIKCAKADGIRDYFHVGVIGYGSSAGPALGGSLVGQALVPISMLAGQPLRVEQRTRLTEDGSGGLAEQRVKFPMWVEPSARGKTAMCQALHQARYFLADFVARHPRSYPPLVINITDGRATDGNPTSPAEALRALATADGNVLLFNIHLSSKTARPVEFPGREDDLTHPYARLLFAMSSPLPPPVIAVARAEGHRLQGEPRGFVFNADPVAVIRSLDVGTRVAGAVR